MTDENEESTGFAFLPSWRWIYALVMLLFATDIFLLIVLEKAFQ